MCFQLSMIKATNIVEGCCDIYLTSMSSIKQRAHPFKYLVKKMLGYWNVKNYVAVYRAVTVEWTVVR